MKILEFTRSFYPSIGGMEKFVSDRLEIYKSLGYDYQVITTTHSEKKLLNTERLEEVIYLQSYTPYGIVPKFRKTMEQDYDIVSINQVGYYYSSQAIKIAKSKGKKIILTPHFYFHSDRFKLIKDVHLRFIVPKLLNDVDKIICFTKFEANFWMTNSPFAKDKIVIIPHYFNPPTIKVRNRENKYGNFFLFLGRGEVNKRIDLLIKAFNKIRADYQLVLTIGDDEISSELQNIVTKNKRINLLGRVSETEKQNLLFSSSALVLPTDFEAFGIVNLEASYYSKPILLSELKVFKNILDDRGVIYFQNKLENVEKAIKTFMLLSDKQKSFMGEINYNNLEKYSYEKTVEKYYQLFTEIIL